MGWLSLVCAVCAALAVLAPGPGLYLAMGLGLFGLAAGLDAWRRDRAVRSRLAGAGGAALAGLVLAAAALRYGLALAALSALTRLLG